MIISQEQFYSLYASELGVPRESLSDEYLRLGLALYHAFYLPTAALIELRAGALDELWRHKALGFQASVVTNATALLQVTVTTPPTLSPYILQAPFIITQGEKRFVATTPLTIPVGQTVGTAEVKALVEGSIGTPENSQGRINASVGWLRGATISFTSVIPGSDGLPPERINRELRRAISSPDALVRGFHHADYVEDYLGVGRAIATERASASYANGNYSLRWGGGSMILAFNEPNGAMPTQARIDSVRGFLMGLTVPYDGQQLTVVPLSIVSVTGQVALARRPGVNVRNLQQAAAQRLNSIVNWRTWPKENRAVYAGVLYSALASLDGVAYVRYVRLNGKRLDGQVTNEEFEPAPYEVPNAEFSADNIVVTEEDGRQVS